MRTIESIDSKSIVRDIADAAYFASLHGSGGKSVANDLRSAVHVALIDAVHDGRISTDAVLDEWARGAASITDQRQADAGKHVLRKVASGQQPIAVLLHDVVCPLGHGERVLFRDMDLAAFLQADQTRYEEKRASDVAYDQWRSLFSRITPVLERTGLTLGEAFGLGMFDESDA